MNHKFRKHKHLFDGTIERGGPPKSISSDEILHEAEVLEDLILTKAPHMK